MWLPAAYANCDVDMNNLNFSFVAVRFWIDWYIMRLSFVKLTRAWFWHIDWHLKGSFHFKRINRMNNNILVDPTRLAPHTECDELREFSNPGFRLWCVLTRSCKQSWRRGNCGRFLNFYCWKMNWNFCDVNLWTLWNLFGQSRRLHQIAKRLETSPLNLKIFNVSSTQSWHFLN
jgi:hypothetical protein